MTDADLLAIYPDYVQMFFLTVTLSTSVLFSYLVVAYLAVERLTWPQLALVSVLFFGLSMDLAGGARKAARQVDALEAEIVQRVERGGSSIEFFDTTNFTRIWPEGIRGFWILATLLAIGFAIMRKRGALKEADT